MAKLEDIISPSVKNKLKKIKTMDTSNKGKLGKGSFVGQTPNLNSSLGMNAADGMTDAALAGIYAGATPEPAPTESKLSTFWSKNSTFLTGLGGALLGGITGNSSTPPPVTPIPEKKKGIPTWAWILIAIVVIVIIVLLIKKFKK